MELDEVRRGLEAFIADEVGSSARLGALGESDGHAGLTFLFEIEDGAQRRPYVIKLPPRGVRRSGNTDVYRQAPLLRALKASGLPVPDVPYACASENNAWFGLPFIVMERLPGHTFFVWDPAPGVSRAETACRQYWEACVRTLARLHEFDWQRFLPEWETPMDLEREITRWERIYAQAPEPEWVTAAAATQRALLDSRPEALPFGLFHGDYQPGNCLYQDGLLVGVIDWELSGIGAQLLDLGWLLMVSDSSIWTPGWTPVNPLPLARVRALYSAERGREFDHVDWFHALANYRLASIACLNVKLHRTGKRHDPIWEHNGRSVLPMYERARALLGAGRR